VQAVGGGIEADIEGYFFFFKKLNSGVFIGRLVNKTAFLKVVVCSLRSSFCACSFSFEKYTVSGLKQGFHIKNCFL